MKTLLAALLAATALLPLPAAAKTTPARADLLIRHATLVDVEFGRLVPDQAVATRGDQIVAVGNDATIAAAWRAGKNVEAKGRYRAWLAGVPLDLMASPWAALRGAAVAYLGSPPHEQKSPTA